MLYIVIRRMQNAYNRGYLRICYETKHSPGYNFTYTEPFAWTGQSTLDCNVLLHPTSSDLTGAGKGINAVLMPYSHPLFPSAGSCLRVWFPEEFKKPGTEVGILSGFCH